MVLQSIYTLSFPVQGGSLTNCQRGILDMTAELIFESLGERLAGQLLILGEDERQLGVVLVRQVVLERLLLTAPAVLSCANIDTLLVTCRRFSAMETLVRC